MIRRIQSRPRWQRILIFVALVLLVLGGMLAITVPIVSYSYNDTPRSTAVAMLESITVREFAFLPDENAYPAALALAADGTLYTGSYVNGTVWRITPDGNVTEITGAEQTIGAVTGLDIAPDGTLYVLDRLKPLAALGAIVWRIAPDSRLTKVVDVAADVRLPYDVAVDGKGRLYISDAHPQAPMIWRYDWTTNTGENWWQLPTGSSPTRIIYNPQAETVLVADTGQDILYSVRVDAANPAADAAQLYQYTGSPAEAPGLEGIAVTTDDRIFVSALGLNRVAQVKLDSGMLDYLAGAFRGSSDIAYDPARQRLYVTNWEQRSLLPEPFLIFQIDILPHLPFAIDVIEWNN